MVQRSLMAARAAARRQKRFEVKINRIIPTENDKGADE